MSNKIKLIHRIVSLEHGDIIETSREQFSVTKVEDVFLLQPTGNKTIEEYLDTYVIDFKNRKTNLTETTIVRSGSILDLKEQIKELEQRNIILSIRNVSAETERGTK